MQAAAGFGRKGQISYRQDQTPDTAFRRRKAAAAQSAMPVIAAAAVQPSYPAAGFSPAPSLSEIDEADMMRYIGGNWHKYQYLWLSSPSSGQVYTQSFCWPAFFFGSFWLLYRKHYAAGFATFAIGIATHFISPNLNKYTMFTIGVALAIYGKSLILNSGMQTIRNIKSLRLSPSEESMRIMSAGGTSWAPVVLPLVLLMFAGYAIAANKKRHLAGAKPPVAVHSKVNDISETK